MGCRQRRLSDESRRAHHSQTLHHSILKRSTPLEATLLNNPLTVAVTGSAGQIGYNLVFRIAAGELFGKDTPVRLRLHELEPVARSEKGYTEGKVWALEALAIEIDDCAFPLLQGMTLTSDFDQAFDGCSWAIVLGAVPRRQGMERRDLVQANASTFAPLGKAISRRAAADVRVCVVGNPSNTNCLIARENAPDVSPDRWFSMMTLDANRAKTALAKRAGVHVTEVSNVCVWGNHSATQFPDAWHAKIGGKPATNVIADERWLQEEFVPFIQNRGAQVIAARGASSAASAASAVIDMVRAIRTPTPLDDWVSLGVRSSGEYGIPAGLQFGLPVRSHGDTWEVVGGIEHGEFARRMIQASVEDLVSEREAVGSFLPR
ncbi:MAG: malate dehydrogenase [Dehalococcoidia bacterium]